MHDDLPPFGATLKASPFFTFPPDARAHNSAADFFFFFFFFFLIACRLERLRPHVELEAGVAADGIPALDEPLSFFEAEIANSRVRHRGGTHTPSMGNAGVFPTLVGCLPDLLCPHTHGSAPF